ncbi:MAG: hypothetical protein JWQ45_2526, partial [Blastococcus sp.]|nr:hypothetical protein [Blastococcus sp.]
MRRLAVLVMAASVLLAAPLPAAAAPAPKPCSYDARGAVPAGFVLDSCIDVAGVALRNTLDVPVVVGTAGDLGPAVRLHTSSGDAATITRYAAPAGEVLLPGDVVRWRLGAGPGDWTVSALDPPAAMAVAESLARFLPEDAEGRPDRADQETFAALIHSIVPAVTARMECVQDANFLGVAACDVDASAAIARAVADRLPRAVADEVTPAVLDAGTWAVWAGAGVAAALPAGGELRLRQGARPASAPPVPAWPPVPASPSAPG